MGEIMDKILNAVGLGDETPIEIDLQDSDIVVDPETATLATPIDVDGNIIPDHVLSVIQNTENFDKYKALNDFLVSKGYVVLLNDTLDIMTVSNEDSSFQINLDRPEEELIQEYGG